MRHRVDFCRRSPAALLGLSGLPVLLALLALLLAGLGGCTRNGLPRAEVLVRLAGEELTHADFEAYLERNVERGESTLASPVLSRLFDRFLDERLLLRLAIDEGLDAERRDQRSAVEHLLAALGEQVVPESQVLAYYQASPERFQRAERVRLRQILVHDPKVAAEAREAVLAGEDFAAVAAGTSEEPNAGFGGDQGQLSRADLPPAFADIIFQLAPGEVSDIVAADYGYHLFQVVERHPPEVVPFEQVRDEIHDQLLQRHVDRLVDGFLETAKERYDVEVFRNNFPFNYQGAYGARKS